MARKPRTTRLYTDLVLLPNGKIDQKRSSWDTVVFSDGTRHVSVPIGMTTGTIKVAQRGMPYECVLANDIRVFAKANPDAFPHPVIYVYVTRTAVYIADKKKDGRLSHAVRYMHAFSSMTKTFDTITKRQFIRRFAGQGFTLTLKPGRKYRGGESKVGGNGKGGSRSHTMSRGAKGRAIAAGLIPGVEAAA